MDEQAFLYSKSLISDKFDDYTWTRKVFGRSFVAANSLDKVLFLSRYA